jgi:sugar lactone lactonase YvrE
MTRGATRAIRGSRPDSPQLLVDAHAKLGEGPSWDALTRRLLWVDILGRRVHAYDPVSRHDEVVLETPADVGAAVPRAGGGIAIATDGAFATYDAGATRPSNVVPIGVGRLATQMNDGKCDSRGRFWAGTVSYESPPGSASLYCLDQDLTIRRVLDGVTVSNGLGWSPAGDTMYYIDTSTGGIDAFDFDTGLGGIGNRRRVISVPPENGVPDGLAVDIEGGLWVALWGGGIVQRYSPDGLPDQTLELPCRRVTSCAFGGPTLDELFITTASAGLTADELRAQPTAGGLFSCHPGATGLPTNSFAA